VTISDIGGPGMAVPDFAQTLVSCARFLDLPRLDKAGIIEPNTGTNFR